MIIFLIFLSFYLGNVFTYSLLAFLIVAVVFLFCVFKRFKSLCFFVSLGTILLGISYSFINVSFSKSSYDGLVYTVKENYFLINSGGERLYVYKKNHAYDIGDYLSISGEKKEISTDVLESGFDFKEYLNKKGVYKELTPSRIEIKFHNFIRINEARNKVLSHFNQEERSIIGAILFSSNEESDTKDTLTNLHLTRFLSSSGLYLALFAMILNYLLGLFMKGKYGELITISLLTIYMVFTFPRFSTLRIVLILAFKWINTYLLKKKFSYLEVISIVGIFCLLVNRHLALQESLFLGFFIPIIFYLIRYIFPSSKIKAYLMKALTVYLFFIPFEALFYNKIVILSFPLQIISTPLFLLIGLTSLLCFFKIPVYAIDKFFIYLLSGYCKVISPLSFGILLPNYPIYLLFIYYATYCVYLYYLGIGYHPIRRLLTFILVVITSLHALPLENRFTNEVNFINVDQGDCTLIRYHQKVILIDTGGLTYRDIANDNLIPYLRKKRIYKIDSVFITHYDYDHYGALADLQKEYQVGHIYDYSSSFPVNIGNLTFNNYNTYGQEKSEENDKSLVLSFNICNKDFVVMGDAPSWVEKEIIKDYQEIPCDILRVGHHGSDTSSCDEWLTYLYPQEAVISVGKNNRYGHPSKSVLNSLNKHGIKIRRTDLEGTIIYKQFAL